MCRAVTKDWNSLRSRRIRSAMAARGHWGRTNSSGVEKELVFLGCSPEASVVLVCIICSAAVRCLRHACCEVRESQHGEGMEMIPVRQRVSEPGSVLSGFISRLLTLSPLFPCVVKAPSH